MAMSLRDIEDNLDTIKGGIDQHVDVNERPPLRAAVGLLGGALIDLRRIADSMEVIVRKPADTSNQPRLPLGDGAAGD
jgi:hypothetical protein